MIIWKKGFTPWLTTTDDEVSRQNELARRVMMQSTVDAVDAANPKAQLYDTILPLLPSVPYNLPPPTPKGTPTNCFERIDHP